MTKRPLHKLTGDLMSTAIISLRETDRASLAIREMALSAIRHLPVVDDKGRLAGIVSSTDLVVAMTRADDPELQSFMTRDVRTVRRDTPAERAVEIMIEEKFSSLPVTAEGRELVGIITATDFLVVAHQALTGSPIERAIDEV